MKITSLKHDDLFNPKRLERIIENTVNGLAMDIKADFQVTTQTWSDRPVFKIKKDGIETTLIFTDSLIYFWLNDGTRSNYPITPKRPGGSLRFNSKYKSKTRPNNIGSRPGGSSPPVRYAKRVIHPGIKARKFSKAIAKKWQRLAPNVLQRAISSELD